MKRQVNPEHLPMVQKYQREVDAFRTFCIQHGYSETFAETDFNDLSLGFFIALGVTGDSGTGEDFHDAQILALVCRYDLEYWTGESL